MRLVAFRPGKPRVDGRRVIGGILHVLKAGCRCRDVPPEHGPGHRPLSTATTTDGRIVISGS
jgi:transposase